MSVRLFTLLALVAAPALLSTPAAAGVIVVDPGGGDGTALLQGALDAALDGDVVLVRPGVYGPAPQAGGAFRTRDRSCTLVADAGGAPIALWGLSIATLSAGREIVVRGFAIGNVSNTYPLQVENCPGLVRFEECSSLGHKGFFVSPFMGQVPGVPGLVASRAENLVLERCTFTGGAGADADVGALVGCTPGGPGVRLTESRVAVLDSSVTGGKGGLDSLGFNFGNGGDGVLVDDADVTSHVLAFGVTLQGGAGGDSTFSQPGDGGAGLRFLEASGALWTRGANLLGGAPGTGAFPASTGMPYFSAAPVTEFTAPWGSASLAAPLREGETASLTVTGRRGDAAFVLVAPSGALQPLSAHEGALLVQPEGLVGPVAVGTIGAGGSLSLSFLVPALPPSLQNATIPVQAALLHAGELTLGGVTHFVWVDAAF